MKYLLLISILFISCQKSKVTKRPDSTVYALKVFNKFNDLAPLIFNDNDTTYVVNFWATSCPPCIKEMPHFNELEMNSKDKPLKIYLISLDLIKDTESRVRPFIHKHNLLPQVIHLKDDFYSQWTDDIDPSWYGALPATLIVKKGKRNFTFGAFATYKELTDAIDKIMY